MRGDIYRSSLASLAESWPPFSADTALSPGSKVPKNVFGAPPLLHLLILLRFATSGRRSAILPHRPRGKASLAPRPWGAPLTNRAVGQNRVVGQFEICLQTAAIWGMLITRLPSLS